jgi:DNA-binding response OmpR family regulator
MAKLLVIDDDHDTCEYLKEFFEMRKCVVFTARSGDEGLLTAAKEKPDIVLLDIRMKGIDGLDVLKEIKNLYPGIRVIMITVASDEATRQKAEELGADDFIKKPFNTRYLEGAVSQKVANLSKDRGKNRK